MLLTKCTPITVIEYCYYTVIGRVAVALDRCHVSRAATFTRVKVRLHFTRELTKELGHRTTDRPTERPTDRSTPTVTSYPIQNPNTYHPNVWGKKNGPMSQEKWPNVPRNCPQCPEIDICPNGPEVS